MSDGEAERNDRSRPAVVRLEGCLLAEVVHVSLELLYDIAVEVSGVQDEQGMQAQPSPRSWILGSLMVVVSPTAGCAAYGRYVKRGFLLGRVRSWPILLKKSQV